MKPTIIRSPGIHRYFSIGTVLVLAPVFAAAQALTVTHFAGSFGGSGFQDGTGSAARFNRPSELAVDGAGNLYVADAKNGTLRIVSPAGVVTTLAGLGGPDGEKGNPLSVDGIGNAARFNGVLGAAEMGVAIDGSGVVYVADGGNCTIRRVSPAGVVTTIAGLAGGYGYVDDTGANARFNTPVAIAVDGSGTLFVADAGNGAIRAVSPGGGVSTFAAIPDPRGIATGPGGFIYVASSNGKVYKISGGGSVVEFATGFFQNEGIAVDGAGTVYVTSNYAIYKIDPAGVITWFTGGPGYPGNEDGAGVAAHFFQSRGLAVDALGNVYVADTDNHTIRAITPAGLVSTRAGLAGRNATGGSRSTNTDGNGSAARFQYPSGIASDGAGNLYVTDTYNFTVRKITPAADVTTIGGGTFFNYPGGIASDSGGTLYVTEYAGAFGRITQVTPAGVTSTFLNGFISANTPGLAVDSSGVVYAADSSQHVIWRVTAGSATVLAGLAYNSGFADGAGGAARFNGPHGIAWDGGANLYVTDAYNNAVRKVVIATGEVTTVAGGNSGSWDETGLLAAFSGPTGIAVSTTGDIYVAETNNLKIRRVTPAGVVTSVAGTLRSNGYTDFTTEGTGPEARFAYPVGIARGPAGSIYILDQGNDAVNYATPALQADVAIVSPADGNSGTIRQLDTAPQTATAWDWQMIRKPNGSSAALSSSTIRNPTFTPDAADMFQFRLTATGPAGRRISTVSLFGCNRAVIQSAPADALVCPGSTLYFAVSASGSNLLYQWKRDGVNYGGFGGGVNPTLLIGSTQPSASGGYSCAVTNACGTIETAPARITYGNAAPGSVGNTLRLDRSLSAVTWGEVTNQQSYSVYENTAANGAFTTLTGTANSGATGVPVSFDATNKFYKVVAVNACGTGP